MRRILLFASLLSFLLVPALAAPASAHDKSKETLTGCLLGPGNDGSYVIRTSARAVAIDTSSIDVSKSAGHAVKVTGTWTPANEKESARMIGEQAEGYFRISKVHSVASTCVQ